LQGADHPGMLSRTPDLLDLYKNRISGVQELRYILGPYCHKNGEPPIEVGKRSTTTAWLYK